MMFARHLNLAKDEESLEIDKKNTIQLWEYYRADAITRD